MISYLIIETSILLALELYHDEDNDPYNIIILVKIRINQ